MRKVMVTIVGMLFVLSTAACVADGGAPPAVSNSTGSELPSAGDDSATSSDPTTADDVGASPCNDSEFIGADPVPAQLLDLGIPFYPCVIEMEAVTADDPLFVGEYVTSHELSIVLISVTAQLDESDWHLVDSFVEGSNTITMVQKPGYSLVIAVGPTRTVETDTSIYYTLRAE